MQNLQLTLFNILVNIASPAMFIGSIFLFIRGRFNRPRMIMAIILMYWSLVYATAVYTERFNLDIMQNSYFDLSYILFSNLDLMTLFIFPVEVLLPGWLNLRRIFKFLSPILGVILFYAVGVAFTGGEVECLNTFEEFQVLVKDFNVWGRFLIIIANIAYAFWIFRFIYRHKGTYDQWMKEYQAGSRDMDISWLDLYLVIAVISVIPGICIIITGSVWCLVVHTLIIFIGFMILLYKALFYESPYPSVEVFKSSDLDDPLSVKSLDMEDVYPVNEITEISNQSFESKIPSYVAQFEDWMKNERPYLYRDFKLTDVSRILPLNRSYLSRVFNEGLHQNFSEVVRSYRVEYSKRILEEHPDFPISRVAELSGFSSDSTFIRAFQKEMGITPKHFICSTVNSKIIQN